MIWNESIECMDRENLRKLQSMRLKKSLNTFITTRLSTERKMQEMGITPDDIHDIDDLVKLPLQPRLI